MAYSLKIGNVSLENPFILAPMAGITNLAFRLMCRMRGASLVYTEMVSSDAIIRTKINEFLLLKTIMKEHPLSIQIFGSNRVSMEEAARQIEKNRLCEIIDINMGCPSTDITGQGSGAELLKDQGKAEKIVSSVVSSVNLPVTAKIRIGINKKINAVQTAKMLEESGVKAIAVHGRTLNQGYSGKADWETIKRVKDSVNIPVIGNGDISKPSEAVYYLRNGYCDAVMIGRAAMGDPGIFERMNAFFNDKELMLMPSNKEKLSLFFEYIDLAKKFLPEKDVSFMRTQAQYFTKGTLNSASLRNELNNAKSIDEIKRMLERQMKRI